MPEIKSVVITGKEILDSIPGEDLLNLAILKLLMEGKNWREFAEDFPRRCWDMSIVFSKEGEPS